VAPASWRTSPVDELVNKMVEKVGIDRATAEKVLGRP
jgi:hypothetical protein